MHLEDMAYEMFDKLNSHLNEKITYEIWQNGRLNKFTDLLTFVHSFKGFGTEKKFVPFISENQAVKSIKLTSTSELLYKNPYLKSGYGKNNENVEAHVRDLFGDRIANEYALKQSENEDRDKIIKNDIELDIISKKNKLELIKEGLNYIKEETVVDFVSYVNDFGSNAFGSYIIDKSINCMKKMEENVEFDLINDYIAKNSRNSIIEIAIAGNVIKYGKKGHEFSEYYCNKYGFNTDNKTFSKLK